MRYSYTLYESRESRNARNALVPLVPLPLSLFLRTPLNVPLFVKHRNVVLAAQICKYTYFVTEQTHDDRASLYRRSFSVSTRIMPGKLQVAKVSYAHNVNKICSWLKRKRETTLFAIEPLYRHKRKARFMPAVYDGEPQGRSKVAQ